MPFNPNATYRTVVTCDKDVYLSQGGKYYSPEGDELDAIPRSANGYVAPTDANLVLAATSGTITGLTNFSHITGAFSSTGAGTKTLTATSTGSVVLGATGTGTTTLTRLDTFSATSTDSSGTPGNATINTLSGRAAFAAAASTVVITNSKVTAASKIFVQVNGNDATLKSATVTAAAGSFTVTGNAAATATTVFDFFVVN